MFTHEYIKMHIETKTLLTHAFLRKLVTHQKQPFDRTKEAHVPLKTAVSTRQLTPTVYRPSPSNPPCSAVSSLYQTNASNVLLHVIIYCYTYILIIIITYRIFLLLPQCTAPDDATDTDAKDNFQNVHIDVCCDVSEQCFTVLVI